MNTKRKISNNDHLEEESTNITTTSIAVKNAQSKKIINDHVELDGMLNPSSYEGLYGFHKYWGKKPAEPLRFLINVLTNENGVVCDPFIGGGAIAREASNLRRKFIGGDLNPFSVKLARFVAFPCSRSVFLKEIERIAREVQTNIERSYGANDQTVVSHVLWVNGKMNQIWERPIGKRKRIERLPNHLDQELYDAYQGHEDIGTRPLIMFDNSRINTKSTLEWRDLFTGRAMSNIKTLKEAISRSPESVRDALELTLTSSIGQMSNMVFAITSRGKSAGKTSNKIEVGSWVIGYWRPETHFEINVWNCFESKANKLSKGLPEEAQYGGTFSPDIRLSDAFSLIENLEDESLELLITDPPHGDRIPYLELSELWNATLNLKPDLEAEIVVSNAKGRHKDIDEYDNKMTAFFSKAWQKLKIGGAIALFFNSRKEEEWGFIRSVCRSAAFSFVGSFPMNYSARSVVQDNRKGSMKSDYVLIFSKGEIVHDRLHRLRAVPDWMDAASVMKGVL